MYFYSHVVQISSEKYNRIQFVPEMFALSTDKKQQPGKDEEGPSDGHDSKTSRTSLQEIELEQLVERNGQEQQV